MIPRYVFIVPDDTVTIQPLEQVSQTYKDMRPEGDDRLVFLLM